MSITVNAIKWSNYTEKELLEMLRAEIIRLGLEECPSRTQLELLHDKNKIPHPNTYRHHLGNWGHIMSLIGLKYDSVENSKKRMAGKRYAVKWADMERDELVNIVLNEMHTKGLFKRMEYEEKRDKSNTPSVVSLSSLTGLRWKEVKTIYQQKYGFLNTAS